MSATTNARTKQMGIAAELSTRDLVRARYKMREESTGAAIPGWVDGLPDAKLSVGLWFQGLREDTVLAFVSNAPGFFERRPLSELLRVDWDSLYGDEQQHLETLGWEEATWDRKRFLPLDGYPESARTDFLDLASGQMVAAVHLGLPQAKWTELWQSMAARPAAPAPSAGPTP